MASPESIDYQPLTKRLTSFAGATRLWHAEDHLLLVKEELFAESYQRFYYTDLHAVSHCIKDRAGAILLNFLVMGVLIFLAILSSELVPLMVFWFILAVFPLWALIKHVRKGKRVCFTLHTALGQTQIPCVDTPEMLDWVTTHLNAHVHAVQGELEETELMQKLSEKSRQSPPMRREHSRISRHQEPESQSYVGAAMLVLALALLLDLALSGLSWLLQANGKGGLILVRSLGLTISTGGALWALKHLPRKIPLFKGGRIIAFATIIYVSLFFYFFVQLQAMMDGLYSMIDLTLNKGVQLWTTVFSVLVTGILAVLALSRHLEYDRYQRESEEQEMESDEEATYENADLESRETSETPVEPEIGMDEADRAEIFNHGRTD